MLIACNSSNLGNPTPKEILSGNKNADIFVVEGIVYVNAENIEWVTELELFKGEKIGEIKNQTDNRKKYKDFTASKLPIGTEIYELVEKNGAIYIIELDGKVIPYLGLIEG